ncbi:MAG TPA: nuclear transport factor 2 family protein [Puia sp.]|nr:nuclear transport factor 2 family protein [Puia sp.]
MEKQVFFEFINAINVHDVDKIYSLMSDDHKFVDAHGNEVTGKEKMRGGWGGYFQLFPDYKIEITDLFTDGDTLAGFGFASGTYKNRKTPDSKLYWRLSASWKAW